MRKNKILELMDLGFSNRTITDLGLVNNKFGQPLSIRSVQNIREEWHDGYEGGRMSNMPLFSYNEVLSIMKNPELFEEILGMASIRYYTSLKPKKGNTPTIHKYNLRLKVLREHDYQCEDCGSRMNLEAHHIRNPKGYNPVDCVCLCRRCHGDRHSGV